MDLKVKIKSTLKTANKLVEKTTEYAKWIYKREQTLATLRKTDNAEEKAKLEKLLASINSKIAILKSEILALRQKSKQKTDNIETEVEKTETEVEKTETSESNEKSIKDLILTGLKKLLSTLKKGLNLGKGVISKWYKKFEKVVRNILLKHTALKLYIKNKELRPALFFIVKIITVFILLAIFLVTTLLYLIHKIKHLSKEEELRNIKFDASYAIDSTDAVFFMGETSVKKRAIWGKIFKLFTTAFIGVFTYKKFKGIITKTKKTFTFMTTVLTLVKSISTFVASLKFFS